MSSRRSKKSASNRYPSNWSEWEWNDQYNCNLRYRETGNNDWEYEYGPVHAESEGPLTASTESAYLDPSGEQPRRKQDSGNISQLDYHDDANPPDDTHGGVYDAQDNLQGGERPENGMAYITNGLSQITLTSEHDHYSHDNYSRDQSTQGYSPYPPSYSQPVYAQQPYEPCREKKMKTITAWDSHNKHKVLDYRYKIHKSSEFQIGRVFELPWDGPKSNSAPNDNMLELDSDITDSEIWRKSGSYITGKVRKFVVIDSGDDIGHSICLSIRTYGYRGVTKDGVRSDHHAAIYTSKRRGPIYLPAETDNGLITLRPIQVELSQTHFKLDKLSRLNYTNQYAIEHNTKVCFIGRVAKHDERQLIKEFDRIWGHDESNSINKRDMNQNQSVDQISRSYPNQGRGDLSEFYLPKNGAGYVQVTAEGGQQFRDYGGQYVDEYGSDGAAYE